MKIRAVSILFVLLMRMASAADIAVSMTAERTQIGLDEPLEIQISVSGAHDQVGPEILNSGNFEVQSTGTSFQTQVINGQMSQQVIFGFSLIPKSAGKFRVGPARVTLGGKTYESSTIDVQVVKGGQAQAGQEKYFYVVGEVDNKTPYVNQQVNYTFKFYNRAELANAQLGLPEFKGLLKEGPDKQQETEQIVNGVRWHVTVIHFALFPAAPGLIEIEPSRLSADAVLRSRSRESIFDDFFGQARTKRVSLRSEPILLTVRPVPSEGKPANFSGLVGTLSLNAQLGKQALSVGDSSTLTVTIRGNGNFRGLSLPEANSQDFKFYDDQPTFEIMPSSREWTGIKTFKRALVPLKSGELEVPSIELTYFDPSSRTFKKAQTQKLKLTASGSGRDDSIHHVAPTQDMNAKKNIEVIGKDLISIKRAQSALRRDNLSLFARWAIFIFCLCCPFIYAMVFFMKQRRDRLSNDLAFARRRKAFRTFSQKLKQANSNGNFFQEGSLLLREYLGNKFNLDGKAITPIDAERKLGPLGVSHDTIKNIESFLRECEAGIYGGIKPDSVGQEQRLLAIVQGVEKEARQ